MEDSSACARALKTGESIFIEDVDQDPEFSPHRKIAAAAGFRAVLSVPVFAQGETFGIFSVHFREPQRLPEDSLRGSNLFVNLAAEMLKRKLAEEGRHDTESRLAGVIESAMDATFPLLLMARNNCMWWKLMTCVAVMGKWCLLLMTKNQ